MTASLALAARKRSEAQAIELEQARREEQARHAEEQEAKFKAEMSARFLAAGGTSAQFEQAWPDMWQQELVRRAQSRPADTAIADIRANIRAGF